MRVHHFSYVLEPPKNQKNVMWKVCPNFFFFFFFFTHIFGSFLVKLHIYIINECMYNRFYNYLFLHNSKLRSTISSYSLNNLLRFHLYCNCIKSQANKWINIQLLIHRAYSAETNAETKQLGHDTIAICSV